ncbi:GDP-mannose 4,6-dehydratase [Nocardioides sp. cx-169]|uniref:GDP-mannose 4,6-dehydratase n=1 Tax=Nocardioides sp. cx-169 TaxID=2899080 RepID=UPI001E43A3B2|nr:GDP-mannose 4,6-dehydratase [Nocardioides sp. cx-169]MCD4533730.1 GDP-mannose 4,6-dehydratase [Nocardioides sp. cx-169]
MVAPPAALVTGVSGQDGVHLARLLADRGTRVVGTVRPGDPALADMGVYLGGVEVVTHDVRDDEGFRALLQAHRPTMVFNLAGFSSVGASWDHPELVDEVNGAAAERMLAALLDHRDRAGFDVRYLQAGSAEETGDAADSPYARSKVRAHEATTRAREEHDLFACTAVLHNHESPLRPLRFVTRKITRAAAEIALGRRDELALGNLSVARDWGAAADYVDAMVRMLQTQAPTDLVIATGVTHTLQDLLEVAFEAAGAGDPAAYVVPDPALLRPADSPTMTADPSEARRVIDWEATANFEEVVAHMVRVDLARLRTGVEESVDYLDVR